MYLDAGYTFTAKKGCFSFLNPVTMRAIEWFRPASFNDDSVSYGEWEGTYVTSTKLFLLNLGNEKDRESVVSRTSLTPLEFHPDNQYSGYATNLKIHTTIHESPFFKAYDGTIISSLTTDVILRDYLEGVDEIVLFTDRVKNRISLSSVVKKPCPG